MQTGSDAPTAFMVGDTVIAVTNKSVGTVISVGDNTVTIGWEDGKFPVEYPDSTEQIRKAWPWEDI